ncbi:MAG: thiopurine S-methyltransferase [Gammaproteobacteria bacterium]
MELEFWEQRWQENQIGFHLPEVNRYLLENFANLNLAPGSQVFVPLCGKSLDMIWLSRQSFKVVGIECSQIAVESFFKENQISFECHKEPRFNRYQSENITILQGDYFDLESADLINISAIYDRASLVALPDAMRQKYADKLMAIAPEKASVLLVTLEYDQTMMSGPPFSVTEPALQKLYASCFKIEKLQQLDIIDEQPRFRQRGLEYMIETVYCLEKR